MQAVVPKCCDPAEMHNSEIVRKRNHERQYLKVITEALQYLGLRGNEDGDDNSTQPMRGKDHPYIASLEDEFK